MDLRAKNVFSILEERDKCTKMNSFDFGCFKLCYIINKLIGVTSSLNVMTSSTRLELMKEMRSSLSSLSSLESDMSARLSSN